jgi:hypothetical protein
MTTSRGRDAVTTSGKASPESNENGLEIPASMRNSANDQNCKDKGTLFDPEKLRINLAIIE